MVRMIRRNSESSKPKATSAARARGRSTPEGDNGMATFAMHAAVPAAKRTLAKVAKGIGASAANIIAADGLTGLDPETAARQHLDAALASNAVKKFSRPIMGATESEFKTLNTETVPLTGTTVVKFRQTFNKIPVYGSIVTVELDEQKECLGINSSLGTPEGVPKHIAKVAPAEAAKVAAAEAGVAASKITATPRLHYYYDQQSSKWALAYIIEDVQQKKREVLEDGTVDAVRKDYVIDAQSGKLIAALPRTPSVAVEETANDGLSVSRTFSVEKLAGSNRKLKSTALNVSTYDFGFKDPTASPHLLPGKIGTLPPPPWAGEAVSAHANAEEVARFLRLVVKRNNIDGSGGEMVSTVNCWDRSEGTTPAKQWKNAYWNGKQMVYGQIKFPHGFFSVANMLDIVGHEMFHGVTDFTSRLEYRGQSGALNESYSDIFGVIIANRGKAIPAWNWKIGIGFDGPGTALRDMQDPTREGQPKLMKNFAKAGPPYTQFNDYGNVHTNSGIHNFAAYKVITAKVGAQQVFTADEVAALFYIALTVHLSRTSQFADSRRAVLQAARSLFRNDTVAVRNRKIKAVEAGFTAAGIK
jgi:Zn-dependent metalloprotease